MKKKKMLDYENKDLMTNNMKGYIYEKFIRNHIDKFDYVSNVWLWKDIPEQVLHDAGLLIDYNRNRLFRLQSKSNNENISRDIGIDIIQLNTDDEYILIQCKNYTKCLCIKHLAGFYMRMCNNNNAKGIVYYSTDKLSSNITNYNIDDRIIYICKPIENEIEDNDQIIKPYPYQSKIIKKLCEYYKNNNKGTLNMPCGAGKTLISCYLGKQFYIIIFISPLKQFAEQNKQRYEEYDKYRKTLLIDSDGTRNVKEIKKFIKNNKVCLLSATYKSCDIILKILPKLKNCLIIIDEFHNLSYNNIYGDKEDPLYNIINSDHKILYMSATPRIYELEDNNDCDIEYTLGKIIYKMDFSHAIKKKYISDYDIILPINDNNDLDKVINEICEESNIKNINIELSKKCCYLYECIKRYGTLKCIIYFQSHKKIKRFIKAFNKLNKYYGYDYYINSIICDVSKKERIKRINEFRSSPNIAFLCSVKILDECIDIQECNSIYITYNCKSKVKNIQRMCRAMRIDKNNKNKKAKIILWCDEFDEMLTYMSSIKEFDPDFHQKITFIKCSNKLFSKRKNNKYNKQYNETYKKYIVGIKEYRGFSWHNKYDKMVAYVEEYDEFPSKSSEDKKIKKLGGWVSRQKKNYKNKICIMKNIEIYDKWTKFKENYKYLFLNYIEIWYDRYDELIKYIEGNNKFPSKNSENKKIKQLCTWKGTQQKNYKKKIKTMRNEEIYNKWTEFKENNKHLFLDTVKIWNNKYNKLVKYIENNKKLPSISSNYKKIKQLGLWIGTQNQNYKKKRYIMKNVEIYNKWTKFKGTYKNLFLNYIEKWNKKYNELVKYLKDNNKFPKISSEDEKIKQLSRWMSKQRSNYKKVINTMKYEEIYDKWTKLKENNKHLFLNNIDIWNNKYDKLIKYAKDNNKLPSQSSNNIEIKQLGGWVSDQKKNYKNKIKSMKNIVMYNKWTKLKEKNKYLFLSDSEKWNNKYNELTKYIKNNNKMPSGTSEDKKIRTLGRWVETQRQNYKNKKNIMKNKGIYDKWTEFKKLE